MKNGLNSVRAVDPKTWGCS